MKLWKLLLGVKTAFLGTSIRTSPSIISQSHAIPCAGVGNSVATAGGPRRILITYGQMVKIAKRRLGFTAIDMPQDLSPGKLSEGYASRYIKTLRGDSPLLPPRPFEEGLGISVEAAQIEEPLRYR